MKHEILGEIRAVQWNGDNLDEVKELCDSKNNMSAYIMDDGDLCVWGSVVSSHFPKIGNYIIKTGDNSLTTVTKEFFESLVLK